MRSCLADKINFGGQEISSDQFVVMCQQGSPWDQVSLLASVFDDKGGSLLYEGLDTGRKEIIRVGEFINVLEGKIISSIASFGSGLPPN